MLRCRKTEWIPLKPNEIVQRYNWLISGLANYFGPACTYKLNFHQLYYLLTYSCYHTLASKVNCRISKIIKKFVRNITINSLEKTIVRWEEHTKEKSISLITWDKAKSIIFQGIMRKIKKTQETIPNLERIITPKVSFRTKSKLGKYCCICGSTEKLQYHHVKHIKVGKVTGFLQVMKQLNRKQIPVCLLCHWFYRIHRRDYDNIALTDLYHEELIIL